MHLHVNKNMLHRFLLTIYHNSEGLLLFIAGFIWAAGLYKLIVALFFAIVTGAGGFIGKKVMEYCLPFLVIFLKKIGKKIVAKWKKLKR